MDRKISKQQLQREKLVIAFKWMGGVVLFVCVVLGISVLFQPAVKASEVFLSKVDIGNIDITVSASGKVLPAFEEIINSPISSRIVEVYKKSGDLVEEGDPILKLDLQSVEVDYNKMLDQEQMKVLQLEQLRLQNRSKTSEMEMKLKVQKMELEQKTVELHNQMYLDSLGAGTVEQVRQAEMNYKVGVLRLREDEQIYENEKALMASNVKIKDLDLNIFRKGLSEMRRTLDDAQIRAPRAAVLSFVNTEIGAQVSQGTKIAMISDLSHFKVEGEIADSYRDKISVGRNAIVKIGKEFHAGVVSNMNPVSNNGVISFSLQLRDSSHPRLRSGLNSEVYIIDSRKEKVMRISNGGYYKGRGEYELFVLNGDMLYKKVVHLGDCNYEYVEVISGLSDGEQVITSDLGKGANKSKMKYEK